jgi:hypothetical protein
MAFLPYIIEDIKDNEMRGAGMNNTTRSGRDKKCTQNFSRKTRRD